MKRSIFLLMILTLTWGSAFGQTYKVLWTFGGAPNDGSFSFGNLIFDRAGNLYGTTEHGGTNDGGTVFELSPNSDGNWSEVILYSFCSVLNGRGNCLDGQWPAAGLVIDKQGNLYGTTSWGGAATGGKRAGTIFQLSPPSVQGGSWSETVLYSFCAGSNTNCQDGGDPLSQLIFDASGNLYGTTSEGGGGLFYSMGGTVFELSPSGGEWTLTTLHSFCVNENGSQICPDGNLPMAGVVFDKSGNLYGTTELGGAQHSGGSGTVYELSPGTSGWTESVLINFIQAEKLAVPLGTVSFDPTGNLYTTASSSYSGVFELEAKSHKQRTFTFDFRDGVAPASGVLVDPKSRAIYGTTPLGGTGDGSNGGGVVFKLNSSGQETVLYNFCQQTNCSDGLSPYAGLIEDPSGNLYGTTSEGGTNNDGGVVFEITP